jgi:hypothetical protein
MFQPTIAPALLPAKPPAAKCGARDATLPLSNSPPKQNTPTTPTALYGTKRRSGLGFTVSATDQVRRKSAPLAELMSIVAPLPLIVILR